MKWKIVNRVGQDVDYRIKGGEPPPFAAPRWSTLKAGSSRVPTATATRQPGPWVLECRAGKTGKVVSLRVNEPCEVELVKLNAGFTIRKTSKRPPRFSDVKSPLG
jgi:hypothetical protein